MKNYSPLFKDSFNKILKEMHQAKFIHKSVESKLEDVYEDVYFEGKKLTINNPFEKNSIFLLNDVRRIIEENNRLVAYGQIVSDIYCQTIAVVFENVINLFIKIFKNLEKENSEAFELLINEYISNKEKKQEKTDNKFLEFKKLSINKFKKEIMRENLKSFQCIDLLRFFLKTEFEKIREDVVLKQFLSENIIEFFSFMKDCRNAIIHNDNIVKFKNEKNDLIFWKYFNLKDNLDGYHCNSLDYEKTEKILEDYSHVIYLIYCALNMKYGNVDELKYSSN